MSRVVEQGELFFFYRNTVGTERARSLDDIQHLYLLMAPDERARGRVLVVGRKRLPDMQSSRRKSTARGWLMTLASGNPETLAERFAPLTYETRTEGARRQAEAIPAGAARYAIQLAGEGRESYLVYRLAEPADPGKAQAELGIEAEGGYVIAVRNPAVEVEGFPSAKPDYPASLAGKFADLRWVEIDDARLLDYERTQVVLISAFRDVHADGLDLSREPDLFATLGLKRDDWPTESLENGAFAEARYPVPALQPEGDRSEAGLKGGRAALEAPSAAGIAVALKGIHFPQDRDGLVAHARRGDAGAGIIDTLAELPDRNFKNMADVEKALGEIR